MAPVLQDKVHDSTTRTVVSYKPTPLTRKIEETLHRAREDHSCFMRNGVLTLRLLGSCLSLA